jgi:hypothetical protein
MMARADKEVAADELSIVDVLLGRHRHQPLMKVPLANRLYANYWLDPVSLEAELKTAGRHRNRPELQHARERELETTP